MRCDYCYNKDIVFAKNGEMTLADVLSFLDTRKNLLDAIVISGGEATRQNLILFCKEVKNRGFKIKLDTNGTNTQHIKKLVDLDLIDYIALDYKAPKYKFEYITHLPINKFDSFEKTLDYLIISDISFEVRTTVHMDKIDEKDINLIIDDLSKRTFRGAYYIQNFFETNNNIANIKQSNQKLNKTKIINKNIEVKYRNF
jgi:pyruvate formate lyase activating enzyme